MKSGATSLELDVTYSFSDEGDTESVFVCLESRRLPQGLAERLLEWLDRGTQDRILDEAWDNAEPENDDDACDDARMPGATG